jgi:ribonuclease HI
MDIYTDGSFQKKLTSEASGWAAIVVKEARPDSYLVDVYYGVITEPDYTKMWNVGGEVYAAIVAIDLAKNFYNPSSLHIYHDYVGLFGWANGKWQPKNIITRGFREFVRKERGNRPIDFHCVKGHRGLLLNEVADFYAGLGVKEYKVIGQTQKTIRDKIIMKNQHFSG